MLKRSILAIVLMSLTLSSMACTDANLQKVAQANQDISLSINALFLLDANLINQKILSGDDAILVTKDLENVNSIFEQFNAKARGYTKLDATAKAVLLQAAADVSSALIKLSADGSLHIKDPQSLVKFQAILTAINTAVATISVVVGG